ncbi:hypothetical protein PC128_g16293 [Phytophthora cactorum]|nr:hypothetical protein PC128_g16293 [Phytophthora cactorum]
MPSQWASEISSSAGTSTNKWSGDGESTMPNSHEYTLCFLGDWAPRNPLKTKFLSSPTADNPPESSAVHEVAATLASPIDQVSCGSGWSCLLCDDGRAYSFGDNTYGQLGQSHDRPYVAAPVPLSTPFCLQPRRRIIRLSCGSSHGGFVLDVGEIYMFGCGSYGRLGTGNEDNTCVPTSVAMKWSTLLAATTINRKQQNNVVADEDEDEVRFTDISCGDRHTLALAVRIMRRNSDSWSTSTKTKTGIISFGDGMNGRLGLGDEKDRLEGALLSTWLAASNVPEIGNNGFMAPPIITAVCAGSTHNLALSASGDVFSWGNGVDGQLGHGIAVSEWVPRQLEFFKNLPISAISCGTSHSMAVSRTGVVYTWGRGADGQLGINVEDDLTIDIVDKSVWVPHPVAMFKGSTRRATIRTIVAKRNMCLALDDRDRMFLWGDNAFEQLGIPLSVSTELGTKSFLPKPKLLAYMDLHAPKSVTCSNLTSTSHVSSLRELVAAAKPDPIRLGLTHVDAGDRFTMLVFTTKPGISRSSNVAGGEISESNSRMPPEASPETTTTTTTTGSKWNFSLTDDLLVSAIPSRESAYYQFMVKYKVYMRPTIPKARDADEESDDEIERNQNMQRRSPHRRGRKGSTISKRGSLPSVDPGTPFSTANEDHTDNASVCSSQKHVHEFDSWLEKRLTSSPKTSMVRHSFANVQRSLSPPSKEEEIRRATCSVTTRINNTPRGVPSIPVDPQKPRSGLCPALSARRPTASARASRKERVIF